MLRSYTVVTNLIERCLQDDGHTALSPECRWDRRIGVHQYLTDQILSTLSGVNRDRGQVVLRRLDRLWSPFQLAGGQGERQLVGEDQFPVVGRPLCALNEQTRHQDILSDTRGHMVAADVQIQLQILQSPFVILEVHKQNSSLIRHQRTT